MTGSGSRWPHTTGPRPGLKEESVMDTWRIPRSFYVIGAAFVFLVFILSSVIASRAQQQKSDKLTLQSLAARVKNLEDENEIQDLLIAYERTLDTRDFKAY